MSTTADPQFPTVVDDDLGVDPDEFDADDESTFTIKPETTP